MFHLHPDQPLDPVVEQSLALRSERHHLVESRAQIATLVGQLDLVRRHLQKSSSPTVEVADIAELHSARSSTRAALDAYVEYQRVFLEGGPEDGLRPLSMSYQFALLGFVSVHQALTRPAPIHSGTSQAAFSTLAWNEIKDLRRTQAAWRRVDGLARFAVFSDELARELVGLDGLIDRTERTRSNGESADVERHRADTLVQLQKIRAGIEREHQHWYRTGTDLQRGEIITMESVQPRWRERTALEQVAIRAERFERLTAWIESAIDAYERATTDGVHIRPPHQVMTDTAGVISRTELLAGVEAQLEALNSLDRTADERVARIDRELFESNVAQQTIAHSLEPASTGTAEVESIGTLAGLRLLAVHAHPDDEASKGSGTAAKYAAEGVEVSTVSLTEGSKGDILHEALDRPSIRKAHGAIRLRDFVTATGVTGVRNRYWGGYADSGMPNPGVAPEPGTLAAADFDEVVDKLVKLMRNIRPHVISTYPPEAEQGNYPHADHVMTHLVAVAAYERAGDPSYKPQLGAPWAPAKLFYMVWADEELARMDTHRFGRTNGLGGNKWTTRVDVSQVDARRAEALLAHSTQIGIDMPLFVGQAEAPGTRLGNEYYRLAHSRVGTHSGDAEGLFAGIEPLAYGLPSTTPRSDRATMLEPFLPAPRGLSNRDASKTTGVELQLKL